MADTFTVVINHNPGRNIVHATCHSHSGHNCELDDDGVHVTGKKNGTDTPVTQSPAPACPGLPADFVVCSSSSPGCITRYIGGVAYQI